MITPYPKQLDDLAAKLGVSLDDACKTVGIAPSTLRRWRAGSNACREDTARKIADTLIEMARASSDEPHPRKGDA